MSRAIYLPPFVLILIGLSEISRAVGYEWNSCYCWNSMNETLKEELAGFEKQALPKYQYIGIQPKSDNIYDPCICHDVTRVETSLKVNSLDVFDALVNNTNSMDANLTEAIQNLIVANDDEMVVINFDTKLENADNSPFTIWNIEVVTKGIDTTVNTKIDDMIKAATLQTDGTYLLANFGTFVISTLAFEVIECQGDPIAASSHGKRNWTDNLRLPGIRAHYTCDDKYFIAEPTLAFSQCDHENVTWTEPAINITCKRGCQEEPKPGPFFSIRNWNQTLREDGDEAIFTCMDGYRSIDGSNGTSVCNGVTGTWSDLDGKFECEQIICPKDVPQVPAFADINWEGSRFIGTKIIYTCIEEYTSTVKGIIRIECKRNGDWSRYPRHFKCIDIDYAVKLGLFDDYGDSYNYYSDGVGRIPTEQTEASYFMIVSMPCFIVMALLILFCLCCTRINSYLYLLCTGKTKNVSYIVQ